MCRCPITDDRKKQESPILSIFLFLRVCGCAYIFHLEANHIWISTKTNYHYGGTKAQTQHQHNYRERNLLVKRISRTQGTLHRLQRRQRPIESELSPFRHYHQTRTPSHYSWLNCTDETQLSRDKHLFT